MNISKLLKKYNLSKSPYIFYDDNMPSMYFTVYENGIWQLYFTNNKEVHKVDFLQDYSIEQVTCFKKQDLYCVSFCSKMGDTNSLFYTETKNPTQFRVVTTLAHDCKSGTVTPSRIFIINNQNHILVFNNNYDLMNSGDLLKETPLQDFVFNFKDPTHITFVNNNDENQIIVSYEDVNFKDRQGSVYINLSDINDQKQVLTENNEPLYDLTIDPYTHQVLYSKRIGLRSWQRKITKTFVKNIVNNSVNVIQDNFQEK